MPTRRFQDLWLVSVSFEMYPSTHPFSEWPAHVAHRPLPGASLKSSSKREWHPKGSDIIARLTQAPLLAPCSADAMRLRLGKLTYDQARPIRHSQSRPHKSRIPGSLPCAAPLTPPGPFLCPFAFWGGRRWCSNQRGPSCDVCGCRLAQRGQHIVVETRRRPGSWLERRPVQIVLG